jgi:hypothetical protein
MAAAYRSTIPTISSTIRVRSSGESLSRGRWRPARRRRCSSSFTFAFGKRSISASISRPISLGSMLAVFKLASLRSAQVAAKALGESPLSFAAFAAASFSAARARAGPLRRDRWFCGLQGLSGCARRGSSSASPSGCSFPTIRRRIFMSHISDIGPCLPSKPVLSSLARCRLPSIVLCANGQSGIARNCSIIGIARKRSGRCIVYREPTSTECAGPDVRAY